jgi:hypothetical protein
LKLTKLVGYLDHNMPEFKLPLAILILISVNVN